MRVGSLMCCCRERRCSYQWLSVFVCRPTALGLSPVARCFSAQARTGVHARQVHTCPTWSWEAGDPKKARPFLPPGKQFLITRNGGPPLLPPPCLALPTCMSLVLPTSSTRP